MVLSKGPKKAKNAKDPDWGAVPMEFIMMDLKNSFADIVIKNKKKMGKDEEMGHCKVNFADWNLDKQRSQMKWIKLQGTTSGEVLVKIDWHGYSSIEEPQKLAQVTNESEKSIKAAEETMKTLKASPIKELTASPDRSSGLLILEVKSAKDLEAKDSDGLSDPFVKIVLNTAEETKQQRFKTSVKENTLTPSWDEKFNLKISDYNKTVLEITVMDRDKFRPNETIGSLSLPLTDIVKNNCKVDAWYPLRNSLGKINISAHCLFMD